MNKNRKCIRILKVRTKRLRKDRMNSRDGSVVEKLPACGRSLGSLLSTEKVKGEGGFEQEYCLCKSYGPSNNRVSRPAIFPGNKRDELIGLT